MDSFTIFFPAEITVDEINAATGKAGVEIYSRAINEISISSGSAHIWIDIHKANELPPGDFDDEEDWPLPKEHVGSVISILVRRNEESDSLAITIAHQLVTTLGGLISWDGMGYWEKLYDRKYRRDNGDH